MSEKNENKGAWSITKVQRAQVTQANKSVDEAFAGYGTASQRLTFRQADAVRLVEDLSGFGEGRLYPTRKDYAARIHVSPSRMSGLGTLAQAIRFGLAEGDPRISVLSSNAGVKAVKDAKSLAGMVRAAQAAAKAKNDAAAKRKAQGKGGQKTAAEKGTETETTEPTGSTPVETVLLRVKSLDEALKGGGLDPDEWERVSTLLAAIVKREATIAEKNRKAAQAA